jgi:hypothetical protein
VLVVDEAILVEAQVGATVRVVLAPDRRTRLIRSATG